MFVGTLIVGIGYLLLSRADNFIAFLVVYIFVISLGASTSFMQATTAGINSWFIRKRGLAMSVNAAAFRLGGAAMVPILSIFVLKYGWQNASIGIGLITFKDCPEESELLQGEIKQAMAELRKKGVYPAAK